MSRTIPDRPSLADLPFHAILPSALTMPDEGAEVMAALVGATIIRIGTTDPGLVEGGGLIIDHLSTGSATPHRLVLGFSERGMWIESFQPLLAAD